jgi:hypothetical protein
VRRNADLASEAALHKSMSQLAARFSALTADILGKKWYTQFEAWLFARRAEALADSEAQRGRSGGAPRASADVLLPDGGGDAGGAADTELLRKLLAAGGDEQLASAIVSELGRLPRMLASKVRCEPRRRALVLWCRRCAAQLKHRAASIRTLCLCRIHLQHTIATRNFEHVLNPQMIPFRVGAERVRVCAAAARQGHHVQWPGRGEQATPLLPRRHGRGQQEPLRQAARALQPRGGAGARAARPHRVHARRDGGAAALLEPAGHALPGRRLPGAHT